LILKTTFTALQFFDHKTVFGIPIALPLIPKLKSSQQTKSINIVMPWVPLNGPGRLKHFNRKGRKQNEM
jgi:hypothetical protein